jgi:O-antigen/teichoic acid export membrane protein
MAVEPILKGQFQPSSTARNNIRRLAGNAISILASDAANRTTTFLLYLLIARYLGAFEYGQFSLGLTFFQTFQLLAIGGMKILVTREVARAKEKTDLYLVNGSAVVILLSAISFTLMVLLTRAMNYAPDTTAVILWLSLGLLPYALATVADALFEAWERMQYITYANVLVNSLKVGLGFLLLSRGYDLGPVVILLFCTHVAAMGVKWWFLFRHIARPRIRIDISFCKKMLKSTATFLGIDGLMAILSSFNVILLSKLAGELQVGLLGAASQLLVPISLVFQSILIGVFPRMCQSYEPSLQGLKRISERLLELLLAMVVPVAVGLFVLADPILLLFYGDEGFSPAAGALRILVGVLVLRVFTQVLGRVLLASLQEKKTLRILAVDVLASVILGPILIGQYGLMGAALTSLLVRVVDLIQHYVPVSRMFSGIAIGSPIWKPAMASAVMAIYLLAGPEYNLFITIALAAAIYGIVMLVLAAWSVGGFHQLKARYLDFT